MAMNIFQKNGYAMMRFMARLMPSCKETAALISENMDRRLPWRKRFSIRIHVMMCSLCRRYEKQLRLLREGTHRYANPEENEVGESLSPAAKERLKSVLEHGGK
jgi:hypothetical protein